MSPKAETVEWYYQDDIARTVREATHEWEASVDVIVDVLADGELDAPRDRIRSMVEVARENIQEASTPEREAPLEPRDGEPRFLDVEDVMYLDDIDMARVVGAVLSRREGSFEIPESVDDTAVDLVWNRQHTTVAFRTIATAAGDPVTEDAVRVLVDSDSPSAAGRSPSSLGIVATAPFTESAVALAEANDIGLFGDAYLNQWLRDAQLSQKVTGSLLEEHELTAEEIMELLAELPPIPERIRESDPLEDGTETAMSMSIDSGDVVPDVDQRMPVTDDASPTEKKGKLYADPGEDGDFGAFDRFVDELGGEDTE